MFGHDYDNSTQVGNQGTTVQDVDEGMSALTDTHTSNAAMPSSDSNDQIDNNNSMPTPTSEPLPVASATATDLSGSTSQATTTDDLMDIKREALQQLKPLIGHLNQTPEEHFQTTMMMIQAADDQSLIGEAYDAAKAINDDKTRAQALLNVVNEINYFRSQKNN